jgi:hypothetical protein
MGNELNQLTAAHKALMWERWQKEKSLHDSARRFDRGHSSIARYNSNMIGKILSGGQTGADRAALDWAIEHKIPHGGWCPKGRKALDGPLNHRYRLTETPTASYAQRTEWNVRDSHATVIFTLNKTLRGGSKKTAEFAKKYNNPCLHISKAQYDCELQLAIFARDINALNIAGPRESEEPGIYSFVKETLEQVFYPCDKPLVCQFSCWRESKQSMTQEEIY